MAKIFHTNSEDFDITRKRTGKSFKYLNKSNKRKIEDEDLLAEIDSLVIPPVWKKVEICSHNCGHIRAVGYDNKGRKQYIYNEKWAEQRNAEKFKKLVDFARELPKVRKKIYEEIKLKKWSRNKILALVILVLDEYHLRIGNKYYEKTNGTFGLTNLRRKHLNEEGSSLSLCYKAKSNKHRKVAVNHPILKNLIKKSSELPGYEIFRYKENGAYQSISSSDVNDYIQEVAGQQFSAKDFRTWGGTVLAVEKYEEAKLKCAKNSRLKLETTLIKLVAKELGNTVSICREYYIHPKVLKEVRKENDNNLAYDQKNQSKYDLSGAEENALEIVKS